MLWLHPKKGLVPPSEFIVPMSDWVFKCSCGYVNQLDEQNLLPYLPKGRNSRQNMLAGK